MEVTEIVEALRPHLPGALIAIDFDGTLAPLVPDPNDSRPTPGSIEALGVLAGRGAQIAVITGRDARTVLHLGGLDAVPGLIIAGLYGLETWHAGELSTPDEPDSIGRLRERLPLALRDADPDVWIEDKRLSLVVHARRAADPEGALAAIAEPVTALGTELGLDVHPGSGVLELRLPGFDKAGALAHLAEGRSAVLFLGDDLGDLPAFAQIHRIREGGVPAYGVGVLSSGVAEVADAADAHVSDPAAAARFVESLAG